MKHYYLGTGGQRTGPFTLAELADRGLSGDTRVWHAGLKDWRSADQIPELASLLADPSLRVRRAPYATACLMGLAAIVGLGLLFRAFSATGPQPGLAREQLALASATVEGSWVSYHVGWPDTTQAWRGSAAAVDLNSGTLVLVTNQHCLGLSPLGQSGFVSLQVSGFAMKVIFPSGQERAVLQMAPSAAGLDLALLAVDATGLAEGTDFVLMPHGGDLPLRIGDEVVAIGTPLGMYAGTQTVGHISAFRPDGVFGSNCSVIQTDAAISHGNSGGPLMLNQGGRFYWIGVNTWVNERGNGLYFAIHAKEIERADFRKYPADKQGAVQALRELVHVDAVAR